jgi:hypothetical protein
MASSRREFVKAATLGAAATAALAADAQIPKRTLGKTGLQVSIMGLGGARIGMLLDNKVAPPRRNSISTRA